MRVGPSTRTVPLGPMLVRAYLKSSTCGQSSSNSVGSRPCPEWLRAKLGSRPDFAAAAARAEGEFDLLCGRLRGYIDCGWRNLWPRM